MTTKLDILEWKNHPVTKAVFDDLRQRIFGLKNEMVEQAVEEDARKLAFKAGAVNAYQDILDLSVEVSDD